MFFLFRSLFFNCFHILFTLSLVPSFYMSSLIIASPFIPISPLIPSPMVILSWLHTQLSGPSVLPAISRPNIGMLPAGVIPFSVTFRVHFVATHLPMMPTTWRRLRPTILLAFPRAFSLTFSFTRHVILTQLLTKIIALVTTSGRSSVVVVMSSAAFVEARSTIVTVFVRVVL